jgi:FixJ family two-component response regulator
MFNDFSDKDVVIYLVDDDELLLRILATKFETSTEYQVNTFPSGEDFLEAFASKPLPKRFVSIVVLDYMLKSEGQMDAKNGVEILKLIKEINPSVHVIVLSGIDDIEISTNAIRYGAHSFIRKNENAFARIHNNIKWILSERGLNSRRSHSRMTQYLFLSVLAVLMIFILYYVFTEILS